MKKFLSIIKSIAKAIVIIFTGSCDEAVDAGIIDLSGEGRNKYGR